MCIFAEIGGQTLELIYTDWRLGSKIYTYRCQDGAWDLFTNIAGQSMEPIYSDKRPNWKLFRELGEQTMKPT